MRWVSGPALVGGGVRWACGPALVGGGEVG